MDGVQDGHFRTGRFQSFQRILESAEPSSSSSFSSSSSDANEDQRAFLPDGISMAKSLGAGFPIGSFWVRAPFADLLSAGTHGTTYGGSPLGCAVALKVLEVIRRDGLQENARRLGAFLKSGLERIARDTPEVIQHVRGLGLMLGLELRPNIPNLPGETNKTQAARVANLFHAAGLLAIPAGAQILRFLPPLNLSQSEAEEGLQIIEAVFARIK